MSGISTSYASQILFYVCLPLGSELVELEWAVLEKSAADWDAADSFLSV